MVGQRYVFTIKMNIQVTTLHLQMFFFLVTGSVINNSNIRQYRNSAANAHKRRAASTYPIEYLNTPNFEVMLLSEEKSNPTWRKYSELFQPKDLRNAPQIEVNYGSHTDKSVFGFRHPSIRLDRSEVESVIATLGAKKHIIVLHPRNCKPHSTARGVEQPSLDEFENEFLPKLLQQLHKRPTEQHIGSDMMDPVIDNILKILDKDEQKMLDDLRKTFETYPTQRQIYSSGYTTTRKRPNANNQRRAPVLKRPVEKNVVLNDPCNEGYVFLVENHKNSMDPSSLNDLLLRVLKVVTQDS